MYDDMSPIEIADKFEQERVGFSHSISTGALSMYQGYNLLVSACREVEEALRSMDPAHRLRRVEGDEFVPDVRTALTDLLAWVQSNHSNYSSEALDLCVRNSIDALAAAPVEGEASVEDVRTYSYSLGSPSVADRDLDHELGQGRN